VNQISSEKKGTNVTKKMQAKFGGFMRRLAAVEAGLASVGADLDKINKNMKANNLVARVKSLETKG